MGVVRYIHIRAGAKALPISGIRIKGPKQDSDAEIGNTKQKKYHQENKYDEQEHNRKTGDKGGNRTENKHKLN